MEVRTGRLVCEQPPGFVRRATRTDLLLMTMIWTPNTVAESDMSLKSKIILEQGGMIDCERYWTNLQNDATQDSNKHSSIWGMFMSSTL